MRRPDRTTDRALRARYRRSIKGPRPATLKARRIHVMPGLKFYVYSFKEGHVPEAFIFQAVDSSNADWEFHLDQGSTVRLHEFFPCGFSCF